MTKPSQSEGKAKAGTKSAAMMREIFWKPEEEDATEEVQEAASSWANAGTVGGKN